MRCSVLHAASQNRDHTNRRRSLRPRLCSAPRREGGALRCVRGTQSPHCSALAARPQHLHADVLADPARKALFPSLTALRRESVVFTDARSAAPATSASLASLFTDAIDPMVVIRWKDIFEVLEEAIDATEKAAQILEGIVIKNS